MIDKMIKDRGVKKIWLANQIGISKQLFSYYLKTGFPPDLEKLVREKLK